MLPRINQTEQENILTGNIPQYIPQPWRPSSASSIRTVGQPRPAHTHAPCLYLAPALTVWPTGPAHDRAPTATFHTLFTASVLHHHPRTHYTSAANGVSWLPVSSTVMFEPFLIKAGKCKKKRLKNNKQKRPFCWKSSSWNLSHSFLFIYFF